jgi:hypothetical protein
MLLHNKLYYNIVWNAKRCNCNYISICISDCRFLRPFIDEIKVYNNLLENKCNVISLYFDKKCSILNIFKYNNIYFLEIDAYISFKYDIIHNSVFNTIINNNTQQFKTFIPYPFVIKPYDDSIIIDIDLKIKENNIICLDE